MCMNKLQKDYFSDLINAAMEGFTLGDISGGCAYDRWASSVIDCALKAGASIFDATGHIQYFDGKSQTCKSYKPNFKNRLRKPWWDSECEEAVAQRKRSFKNCCARFSRENVDLYRKSSDYARRTIRRRKKENFVNFVNDLNENFNIKTFWKTINSFKNSVFFKSNNPPSSSKFQGINKFIDNFSPPWAFNRFENISDTPFTSLFDDEFSFFELNVAIDSSRDSSSPGPDLIGYHLLKLLPDSARFKLLDIFNLIIRDGSYPSQWRRFDVILIPKPNKVDFRPISLASNVLKIFEKMIKGRFEKFIELEMLLPNCQYGFRRGKSCDDCLALINLEVYKAFAQRSMTGALFLDIKGAYDNVNPCTLFSLINKLRIPSGYKSFFMDFLSPRSACFYESGISYGSRLLQRGLPQGSVLSPLLFNLYVKDILLHVPHNVALLQYADDIAILCSDSLLDNIIFGLRSTFIRLEKWLNDLDLSVSLPKTQFTIFHRKRSVILPDILELPGGNIPLNLSVKYLGLVMDRGLRWKEHISSLRTKSFIFVNILKWLAGRSWGISPILAINFINATLGAICEWGSMWYISAARSYLGTVESLLCSAYKVALNIPKSSSNRVCWVFSGQRSFIRRISYKCDKYLGRSIQLRNNKMINKVANLHWLNNRQNTAPSNVPFIVSRWPVVVPFRSHLYAWDVHPVFSFPSHIFAVSPPIDSTSGQFAKDNGNPNLAFTNLISLNRSSPTEIDIFTDGSKSVGTDGVPFAGCSVWIPKLNITQRIKLNRYTSSFSAEALAIIAAVDLTLVNSWEHVNICTDSWSVLQSIANIKPFSNGKLSPLVPNLKSKLSLAAASGLTVRFSWCPAHKGILGNERADSAAKEASLSGTSLNNKISHKDISSHLLYAYIDIDAGFLDRINNGSGRFYMENLADQNLNLSFLSKFRISRRDFGIMARLLAGYPYTNVIKYRFGIGESPSCPCGWEYQDVDHLFWACSRFESGRSRFLRSLFDLELLAPFSCLYLYSNLNYKIVKAILSFIKDCDLGL
ncbi:uncharacterized protein LOC143905419 [Temnothorax americanus]|uniref:uncharacterized protein LOC143905419 n=1 Tax=Temnothorax americanus TaxID=1964332 RepID=UPI0040678E11